MGEASLDSRLGKVEAHKRYDLRNGLLLPDYHLTGDDGMVKYLAPGNIIMALYGFAEGDVHTSQLEQMEAVGESRVQREFRALEEADRHLAAFRLFGVYGLAAEICADPDHVYNIHAPYEEEVIGMIRSPDEESFLLKVVSVANEVVEGLRRRPGDSVEHVMRGARERQGPFSDNDYGRAVLTRAGGPLPRWIEF